jgi:parvulin-like peptidyl-prolyl isomerase
MYRNLIALLLGGLLVAGSAACGAEASPAPGRAPKLSDLFGDEVLARGKGAEVKRSHLEEAFVAFRANLASRGQSIPEVQRVAKEAELLQRLVVTQILTNRVTEADRQVARGLAEKFVAEARKTAVSEDAFNRQLKAMGLTPEQFDRRVVEQSLAEAVIQRELASDLRITDANLREFYDTGSDLLVRLMQADLEKMVKDPAAAPALIAQVKQRIDDLRKANLARLEQPERVRVSHVFLTTIDRKTDEPLPEEQRKFKRQQMEKIRQRALAGEDFARLVQEFSEDRGLQQTKGEYTFSRDDSFAPEFKSAAFSLSPGQISDVVSTPIGLHVIKLLERIPAKKAEFEKVSGDLKEFLKQQELQRTMPGYFARLIKEAGVEVLDPKYKGALDTGAEARKL